MGLDLTWYKFNKRTYDKINTEAFDAYTKLVESKGTDQSCYDVDVEYDDETGDYIGIDNKFDEQPTLFNDNNSRVGSYSTLHKDWRDPMVAYLLEHFENETVKKDFLSAVAMFQYHSDCDGIYTIDQLRFISNQLGWWFNKQEEILNKEYGEDGIYLTNWAKLLRDSHDKSNDNIIVIFC